jgi:hypothetical protein
MSSARAPLRNLHLARRIVDIDQPAPPLRWVEPNVAALGMLTVVSGEGGVGKTSLALQIAADAGDRLERTAIMSAENVSALQFLADTMGIGSESVTVLNGSGVNLSHEGDVNGLMLDVLRAGGLNLLVLDSLSTFAPGLDENAAAQMGVYLDGLQKAAEFMSCAIVLLHHWNKSGSSRGSSVIRDRADFTLDLVNTAERDVIKLVPDKWRLGRKPAPWHMRRVAPAHEHDVLRFERVSAVAQPTLASDYLSMLAALEPGTYTSAELRQRLGLDGSDRDRTRLSAALKRAEGDGLLARSGRSEYRRM